MVADDLWMARIELWRKTEVEYDTDVLCERVRVLSRALIEMEVSQRLNERYKHTAERWDSGTGVAGGSATPEWASSSCLAVRDGSFFPRLKAPRRRRGKP